MPDIVEFQYAELSTEDKTFIKDKVGIIRHLQRNCAISAIHIGQHLLEVRQRIRGRFSDWVESEFSWSRSMAYKMMQVAEEFGGVGKLAEQFDASALYALAKPETKQQARIHAIELAKDGERVTHRVARDIIDAFKRSPQVSGREVKDYFRNRPRDVANPDHEPEDLHSDFKLIVLSFRKLLQNAALVTFSHDTAHVDDDGAIAEDGVNQTWRCSVFQTTDPPSAPKIYTSTSSIDSLILEATNSHPMRKCAGPCGRILRLYEDFSRKKGNSQNRSRSCKRCEVKRVAAHKKKAKSLFAEWEEDPHL